MPISDFLHRATSSKARGSSTSRSQSQSGAPSSNNSDRDDREREEHESPAQSEIRSGRTSPRPGPSSASPAQDRFPDEKRALSPETRASTVTAAGEPPAYHRAVIPREDVVYSFVRASSNSMVVRSEVTGEGVYRE